VAWIILAALGVFYQMRSIAQTAEGLQAKYAVERSEYRIA
jgi:hypothetical protein